MIRSIELYVAFILVVSCTIEAATLSVPSQYSTIQEAINASTVSGDTILLEPGEYSGPGFREINSFSPVTYLICNEGPDSATIYLDGTWFTTGGLNVEGITFEGGSTVIHSVGISVTNCRFINNEVGVKGEGPFSVHAQIYNSMFMNNDTAIIGMITFLMVVDGCLLIDNDIGVLYGGVENFVIWKSILAYNKHPVQSPTGEVSSYWCTYYYNDTLIPVQLSSCNVLWNGPGTTPPVSPPNVESLNQWVISDPMFCDTTLLNSTTVLPSSRVCNYFCVSDHDVY